MKGNRVYKRKPIGNGPKVDGQLLVRRWAFQIGFYLFIAENNDFYMKKQNDTRLSLMDLYLLILIK